MGRAAAPRGIARHSPTEGITTLATRYDWTLGGLPCILPDDLLKAQASGQLIPRAFIERANSYVNPLGMTPGRGWVLMYRKDVVALHNQQFNYASSASFPNTAGTLKIGSTTILKSAFIIKATCMTPESSANDYSIYLVEITDFRYMASMSSPKNSAYNIRVVNPVVSSRDASSSDEFESNSLQGGFAGTIWTWQELCDDIYESTSAITLASGLQTAPTLPYTPSGHPENIRCVYEQAWKFLHSVLYLAGCTTAYDAATDSLTYVRLGTTQSAGGSSLDSHLQTFSSKLLYDAQPIESICMRRARPWLAMPVQPNHWGAETDFNRGASNNTDDTVAGSLYLSSLVESGEGLLVGGTTNGFRVSTNTSGTNRSAFFVQSPNGWAGAELLFDPTIAWAHKSIADAQNANATQITAVVNQRCENHYAEALYSQNWMRKIFTGLIPHLSPGSQCKAVSIYDFGNGLMSDVMNGPNFLADPISGPPSASFEYGWNATDMFSSEKMLQVVDMARQKFVTEHPRHIQIVEIVDGTDPGDYPAGYVTPNGGGGTYFFDGEIKTVAAPGGSVTAAGNAGVCWIVNATDPGGSIPIRKTKYLGRAAGWADVGGSVRPVFLVFPEDVLANFNGCATVVTGLTGVVPAGLTVSTTSVPKSHTCP